MLHFACLWMHPTGSVLRTPDCVCRFFSWVFFFLVCCVCRYLFVHVYNCTSDWILLMFDSGFYLR